MSDQQDLKRKLADDSFVSITDTKKLRADTKTHSEFWEAETGLNHNKSSSKVHFECLNEQEVATTTNKAPKTSGKTVETDEEVETHEGASQVNTDDGNKKIDSDRNTSNLVTLVKWIPRRRSVGSTASVESARRNCHRYSAGASTLITEQLTMESSSSAMGSRRNAPVGAVDDYSVASETPSIASVVEAARGHTAREGAAASQGRFDNVSLGAGNISSSSEGKSGRLSKHQLQVITASTTVPALVNHRTITTAPPLFVPVLRDTTGASSAASAEPHTQTKYNYIACGTGDSIPSTTTAATATEQPSVEDQLDILDFLASITCQVLTVLLVLLLAAVAVLLLQYHQLQPLPLPVSSTKPSTVAVGQIQMQGQSALLFRKQETFAQITELARGQLLAEIAEQEETIRRICVDLDRVRQDWTDWDNASTAANPFDSSIVVAAEQPLNMDPQLILVKLRKDNVLLVDALWNKSRFLLSKLRRHREALQAEAEASPVLILRMDVTIRSEKSGIRKFYTEVFQLRTHVDKQVSVLNSLLKSINVPGHPPASVLSASLSHNEQRAVLKANLDTTTTADVKSAAADTQSAQPLQANVHSDLPLVQQVGGQAKQQRADRWAGVVTALTVIGLKAGDGPDAVVTLHGHSGYVADYQYHGTITLADFKALQERAKTL